MIALDIKVCYERSSKDSTLSQAVYLFWITVGGERMFGPVKRNVATGDSLTAHAAGVFQEMLQPQPLPARAPEPIGTALYTVHAHFKVLAQSAEQACNIVREDTARPARVYPAAFSEFKVTHAERTA